MGAERWERVGGGRGSAGGGGAAGRRRKWRRRRQVRGERGGGVPVRGAGERHGDRERGGREVGVGVGGRMSLRSRSTAQRPSQGHPLPPLSLSFPSSPIVH